MRRRSNVPPSPRRIVAAVASAALLAGCAATPARDAPSPDDPFEPMNRVAYSVHEVVDGHFVKPMVQAYVDYTPQFIQLGIRNFFGNVDDFFSFINAMLQGKPDKAGHDLGRVITNTGFGIFGIIDVASGAVPKGEEDFGQTFGVWGIPQGPYLFIPIFGPTTFRDGSGWIIRGFTTPIGYIPDVPLRNTLWGIGAVDLRAQALQAESIVGQAALDPYTFIRRAYLQRRRYLVYDGQPPPAKEDDE
jgi:phospholipid-binding lipoprotein MlaA